MADGLILTTYFNVSIDGMNLGGWTGVSGISMSFAHEAKVDSAVSFLQNHLPGPLTYGPITLTRIPNEFTNATMAWFSSFHVLPVPATAEIVGKNGSGGTVISWELIGVVPKNWTGPSFKMGEATPGTETLVLEHWGFL